MKTKNMKAWVVPGVLSALLLAACGGGGGGGQPSTPSLTITSADVVTATVEVANSANVQDMQLLVSSWKSLNFENVESESPRITKIRDVLLYESVEKDKTRSGNSNTFSLKNVNFSAASSDSSGTASAATCSSTKDTALGTVLVTVLSEGIQFFEGEVPVCALQPDTTYTVTL